MGQALNAARQEIQQLLGDKRATLETTARRVQLEAERLDLTEANAGRAWGHQHLISQTMQRLEDVFVGMGFAVAEGPEVEDDWHNFGSLSFPDDHPARAMQDTLYVDRNALPRVPCSYRDERRAGGPRSRRWSVGVLEAVRQRATPGGSQLR